MNHIIDEMDSDLEIDEGKSKIIFDLEKAVANNTEEFGDAVKDNKSTPVIDLNQ